MTKTENTTTNARAVLEVVGVRTAPGLQRRGAGRARGYRSDSWLVVPAASR